MHSNMALRIHSYSLSPEYYAGLEYLRDGAWHDLTERLVSRTSRGEQFPITVSKSYRQMYTCSLMLDNTDGLITPENTTSAYNLNALDEYDPLLDSARKVRVKQGIFCYEELSSGKTVTASAAPTAGALAELTDGLYGDPTEETDAEWVHWSAVAASGTIWIKVDLGSSQTVRHGVISFMSKTNASPQIELPATVLFEYSADDVTYYPCAPAAFDLSEYSDSRTGQQFLAWFTDLDKSARYIRVTITNIAEENEIYIDEFALWGGDERGEVGVSVITGYLGDAIDLYSNTGYIELTFEDTRKHEADNRQVELTKEYKDQRPEQIIYDLLTNAEYWVGVLAAEGENLLANPGFESGDTGWTKTGDVEILHWHPRTGDWNGRLHKDGAVNSLSQPAIAIVAEDVYQLNLWYKRDFAPWGRAQARFHVDIVPNAGDPIRFPETGYYEPPWWSSSWYEMLGYFTAPVGATACSVAVVFDIATGDQYALLVDDCSLINVGAVAHGYGGPLTADDIGWAVDENLSAFVIPRWQGQAGTILDYCNELAQLIGWVYDSDGDGVRQFWQPEYNRLTASPYLNFFDARQIGPEFIHRSKTDADIRNVIKIVGYEAGNKEVPHQYQNKASVERYGIRYARITEPLVRTAEVSDKLGKALLRDFAWARDGIEAETIGDFDIDRPKYVCSFHEPLIIHTDKSELWSIETVQSQMVTHGTGTFRTALGCRRYVSSLPSPVANIVGTGGNTQVAVSWDANTEVDIDGYYVYWATGDTPAVWEFTKRAKVTGVSDTVTGLVNTTAYWFYVTAVNIDLVESEPSAIIRCLAGAGNSGSEALTWGISGLAAALTDEDPTVALDLSWTPSLVVEPDYITVAVYGPHTANPPTNETEYAQLTPANAVVEHYHARYRKADYIGSTTYYWRLRTYEVVIEDIHYQFGAPPYSNVPSANWPT